MAIIKPFKALRPAKESAELVASVPYDVVDRQEAKELVGENNLSFLKVSRAEIEFDDSVNSYSQEIYNKAKENLNFLKKEAPLLIDDSSHFYLYRLIMDGRSQIGLAAAFSIDDYDNDVILKHEKTRKEKEDDRTNHIVATEAQTGPVFLTYKGIEAINKIVNETVTNEKPLYDFTSEDGIKHTLWIVPDEYNQTLIEEISKTKNLYIADGHHRAASASRARKVKQDSNPNHNGTEEYNYFLAVLFPAEQLKILPYNRVVFNLNGNDKEEFLDKVSEKFNIEKNSRKEPETRKTYCMYLDGDWYTLKPRDSVSASNSLSKSSCGNFRCKCTSRFFTQSNFRN